jgi:hypothetical protein
VIIYKISITVHTKSERLSDTYSPGDEIIIGYRIIPVGTENKQRTFEIYYGIIGTNWNRLETTELKGNLTYKIPDDISEGKHLIAVQTSCVVDGLTYSLSDYYTINIQKTDTPLDTTLALRETFDYVLLILLIIAFILIALLAVFIMRTRAPPPSPAPMVPTVPPTPAPPPKKKIRRRKKEKGLPTAGVPPMPPSPPPPPVETPKKMEVVQVQPPVYPIPPAHAPPIPPAVPREEKGIDLNAEFAKLEDLYRKGLITEEELRDSKKRLIAESEKKR